MTQQADFTKVFSSFKMSCVFRIQANSGFAIAERLEKKGNTTTFQIISIAHARSELQEEQIVTSDSFSLLVLYVKKRPRKLATKSFDLSVLIFGLCLYIYHNRKHDTVFCIYEVKVCSLLHN
jgi:hypothetical protein